MRAWSIRQRTTSTQCLPFFRRLSTTITVRPCNNLKGILRNLFLHYFSPSHRPRTFVGHANVVHPGPWAQWSTCYKSSNEQYLCKRYFEAYPAKTPPIRTSALLNKSLSQKPVEPGSSSGSSSIILSEPPEGRPSTLDILCKPRKIEKIRRWEDLRDIFGCYYRWDWQQVCFMGVKNKQGLKCLCSAASGLGVIGPRLTSSRLSSWNTPFFLPTPPLIPFVHSFTLTFLKNTGISDKDHQTKWFDHRSRTWPRRLEISSVPRRSTRTGLSGFFSKRLCYHLATMLKAIGRKRLIDKVPTI